MNVSLNRTNKTVVLCIFAVLALSFGGLYAVSAQSEDELASIDAEEKGCARAIRWRGMHFGRMMGSLTEEQSNELNMEIQNLVKSKFEEWGIEPPEPLLTEEQRDELRTGIEELRESDATPEEVKAYIEGKLKAWGVELPECPMRQGSFHGKGAAFRGRRGCLRGFGNNDTE